MARHCTRFCLILAALVGLGPSAPVRAYEDQLSLDMGAGYALLALPAFDTVANGPGAELGVGYGVADSIVVRGNLGYAALFRPSPVTHERVHEQLGRARVEALYQLDIVQWVPFFGLGATVTTAVHARDSGPLRGGGHVLVGIDYLLSRSWVCGIDARTALLAQGHHLASATDVTLRLSRMFEAF